MRVQTVDANGNHIGIDKIEDFQVGEDVLDLRGLIKQTKYDDISDVVTLTETDLGGLHTGGLLLQNRDDLHF